MDLESELNGCGAESWTISKSSDGKVDLALFQDGELIFHTVQDSLEEALETVQHEFVGARETTGVLIRIPEILFKKNIA